MAVRRAVRRVRFAAPFDVTVLVITTLCVIILGGLLFGLVFTQPGNSVWRAIFGFGCLTLLVGSWGFAPSGYRIEGDCVVVERPIGQVVVTFDDLLEVSTKRPARGSFGWLGYRNGGLFGVVGRVYRKDVGWTYFWGRRVSGMVTLQYPRHRVILMPDDPKRFAAAIREAAWRNDWDRI